MLRHFSQFPANFCLNAVEIAQNSDKTKRPAGRFLIICTQHTGKVPCCKCLFYAIVPAPRHGGEVMTVSCKPSHSFRV
ncbi:MAG: hypothetical protein EOM43_08175 [Gammaproteobacteria bacterium]|nr:hypothetical protein [Gammaproteobacteria bacterium]